MGLTTAWYIQIWHRLVLSQVAFWQIVPHVQKSTWSLLDYMILFHDLCKNNTSLRWFPSLLSLKQVMMPLIRLHTKFLLTSNTAEHLNWNSLLPLAGWRLIPVVFSQTVNQESWDWQHFIGMSQIILCQALWLWSPILIFLRLTTPLWSPWQDL